MNIGTAIGTIAGGIVGGVIRATMVAIGIGIAICAFLDILLTYTRDTIFNVAPEAYESGFLTKVSVALSMALIPYMIYLCIFIFMLFPTLMMFLFSGFQTWTWLFPWSPPNFLEDTMGIITYLLNAFGVG